MINAYVASIIVFSVMFFLLGSSLHVSLIGGQLFAGQIGAMIIAAYTTGDLALHGMNFALAGAIGIVGAMMISMIMVILCVRLADFALAIVSTALAQMFSVGISSLNILGGPNGLAPIPAPTTWHWAVVYLIAALAVLGYFHQARSFRQVLAIATDEHAAQTFGINVNRVKILLGGLSGFFAGAAGVLYAGYTIILLPGYFSFSLFTLSLVFTVSGGMWTMWGPLVGCAFLYAIPQYWSFLGQWQLIGYSLFAIAIIMFLPDGITPLLAKAVRLAASPFTGGRDADGVAVIPELELARD